MGRGTRPTRQRAESIVRGRDQDGDGVLTYQEFNRGFTGEAAEEKHRRFTEADTNSDERMTVEEFTLLLEKLRQRSRQGS